MAITLSGQNNVDKITASDGVIDVISGVNHTGVVTATTFKGDFEGNITGNVTGNINNTTLLFQIGGAEKVRIDSAGNMGLGITPDGQGGTVDSLQIGSATNLYNETSDDYTILGNNVYFDGTNNKYIKTQQSSRLMQNAGEFTFQQAASGSADANITYTTPLKISATGLLQATSGQHDGGLHLLSGNNNQSTSLRLQSKSSGGTSYDWYLDSARSADKFSIHDGTTSWLTILGDGKVGLNNTSPATVLDIKSTKASDGLTVTKGSNVAAFLGHNGTGDEGLLHLRDGGTATIQIYAETGQVSFFNAGNVGIGTATPVSKLHLQDGDFTIKSTGECGPYLYRSNGNGPDLVFHSNRGTIQNPTASGGTDLVGNINFAGYDGSGFHRRATINGVIDGTVVDGSNTIPTALIFRTGSTNALERLRIDSNGNVFVNKGNAKANATIILSKTATGAAKLEFDEVTSQRAYIELDASEDLVHYGAANVNQLFYAGGNKRLTILSGGNVGINEDTPTAKLHISHNGGAGIFVDDNSNANNSPYIQVLGKRSDGNNHQSFSGQILLSSLRTDQKVASGKQLGTVLFGGNHTDGTEANILYAASITGIADDNFDSATDMPTALAFKTGTTGRAPATANVSSGDERLRIASDGNVGIARTINSYQLDTSGTPSYTGTGTEYDLSINRECFNSTNAAFLGFNKTLNVDNQYAVSTFRSTNINRNSTSGWMDIAKFVAWDIDAKVIIQAGGTFTGDQVEVRVISSYNSALSNGRSGPYLEVKSTQAHSGDRFTKVRIGCHNSNRHPILQVYFDGSKTHNALGTINVTCHDYGSNYGGYADRGEARFQSGTTLNETWKELHIVDGTHQNGFMMSHEQAIVFESPYVKKPAQVAWSMHSTLGNTNLASTDKVGFNAAGTGFGSAFNTGRNHGGVSTSDNSFTAPVTGLYLTIVTMFFYSNNMSNICSIVPRINNTQLHNGNDTIFYFAVQGETEETTHSGSLMLQLTKGDELTIHQRTGTTGTHQYYGAHSHFQGCLIG